MIAAIAFFAVLTLAVGVGVVLLLRAVVVADSRTEAKLHDPHTHTIAYAVPKGVDPAVIMAAVRTAGFSSVVDRVGGEECVLVACEEGDRSRLRQVIEDAHANAYSSGAPGEHVVFQDER